MFPCGFELLTEHTFNLRTTPRLLFLEWSCVWRSLLVLRITYFLLEKYQPWVGTALAPNTLAGSKPCDSGITLHDGSKRRSFASCELRAKRTKLSFSAFQMNCVCSGECTGQHASRLSPPIRDSTCVSGGVAVASRPEHISTRSLQIPMKCIGTGRAKPHVSAGKSQYRKWIDWGNTTRAEAQPSESTNRIEATSSKLCSGVPNRFFGGVALRALDHCYCIMTAQRSCS
jgi:hypothetical protein